MSILCIIPARGGSQGLPKKNIAMLAGRPLLAHSIDHAFATPYSPGIKEVVVSTDSAEIAEVAELWGARVVMRPPELSGPDSPSEDALRHVLKNIDYRPDIVVFLQATNPLRSPIHIAQAISLVDSGIFSSVLSAVRLHQFVWVKEDTEAVSLNYDPKGNRPMRQDVSEFVENGSIYAFQTGVLEMYGTRLGGKIGIVEMPRWSRFEIDTPEDLELCEWIMTKKGLLGG